MANPYRDDKTGRYTTKADFEAQKNLNKVNREGLNIIKEQNQLLSEQANLRREARSLAKQILNDYNLSMADDPETAYRRALAVAQVDYIGPADIDPLTLQTVGDIIQR